MVSCNADLVSSTLRRMSERESLFEVVKQNDHRKWNAIRKIYQTVDVSVYVPYVVDWMTIFTPIERMAWGEIRDYGLPFFPQFPIGKFFADFADPVKKIVIECDGKAFHNKANDDQRDRFMGSLGWKVFRVSGADCNRFIDDPWEEVSYQESDDKQDAAAAIVSAWALNTVDGLAWALSVVFYNRSADGYLLDIANSVIDQRLSRKCYA